MPVIRIEAIRTPDLAVTELLRAASEAVASAFGIAREACWSSFVEIRPGEVFEGGQFRDGRHSPLVTISAYQGRGSEEIAAALDAVAEVVVSGFSFELGDVFVEFRELAAGTVHTGGAVR